MHKFILFLLLLPFTVFAQSPQPLTEALSNAVKQIENAPAIAKFEQLAIPIKGTQSIADAVRNYYQKQHPFLQQQATDINLLHAKHTVIGWHLYFQQIYNGFPVLGATLKVNLNDQGVTLSVFDKLANTQYWNVQGSLNAAVENRVWLIVNDEPIIAYQQSVSGYQRLYDAQGNLIIEKDTRLYFLHDDTIVSAKVFRPDPLTPIGVIAGLNGTYQHFKDSDYALINNQRVDVKLPVTFNGSVFQLKNKYARIYDTSFKAPNIDPATSLTPTFNFTRQQNGFKDVMALYHVTNTQEYLHSLGIDEVKYQLKIDAHSSTSDQSYFEYDGDTSLNFGTGGVPDAEDADVIVHEFTHAVSFSINPSINMSSERRAIEEATCDIMAAIYSKRYAPFNWRRLFNWDAPNPFATGVNPFWNGRNGNSTKTYANLTSDPYGSSEIWTSTLLDIEEQIGSDSTIMLMFASLASYTDNTTMPQAAQLFMQADSVLINKHFGWKIGPVFNARLLGNFPTSINEQLNLTNGLTILNTQSFASGEGNAIVNIPLLANVVVYDIQGKKLMEYTKQQGPLVLNPADFTSGIYIVRITAENAQLSLKILKY
jgi:hypothetical protein